MMASFCSGFAAGVEPVSLADDQAQQDQQGRAGGEGRRQKARRQDGA